MIRKLPWIAFYAAVLFTTLSCSGPEQKEPWLSTTETFLSELGLMQGDKESFTPDTYYALGGIVCVVSEGEAKLYRPFGYSSSDRIEDLLDQPASKIDPSLGTPVVENSLFRLGSTSKMFVGLALAMCKDEGSSVTMILYPIIWMNF